MKQKFTNLHYGNRDNLCSKNFWKESSIQVVTQVFEKNN